MGEKIRDDLRMCTYRYAQRLEGHEEERDWQREKARTCHKTKLVSWLRPHTRLHRNCSVCCKAEQHCWKASLMSVTWIIQLWPDVLYICTNMWFWMLNIRWQGVVPKWYIVVQNISKEFGLNHSYTLNSTITHTHSVQTVHSWHSETKSN